MIRRGPCVLLGFAILVAAEPHGRRRWQQYEREMQNPADDPPDACPTLAFTAHNALDLLLLGAG